MSSAELPVRSYRPGSWFGIVGRHALVVLPPGEKARVSALWELVDDGAGFDVTLDALISGGLRSLPAFVLVATEDARTDVVIRGAATATFTAGEDEVVVEGSSATTWAERSLDGVTRMVVDVEPVGDGPGGPEGTDEREVAAAGETSYVVDTGLFRISRLEETRDPDAGPRARALHVVAAPPRPPIALAPVADDGEGADDGGGAEDVGDVDGDLDDDLDEDLDEDLEPEVAEEADPPIWAPVEDDPVTEADVPARSPEPPSWTPPPPPVTDVPADDHDGLTILGAPPPPPSPPGIPGQEPAPDVTQVVARLVISSGQVVEVDRVTVIGRAPDSKQHPAADPPRLVTVPSPHSEISSTHIEVRPGSGADHGSAVVTDLGSTNGTVVVQPGLGPQDLAPGEPVQLLPGALIDIGDGITIQVARP